MGGANGGEKASSMSVKLVKEYVRNNFIKIERNKEELENLIRNAMNYANKKVFELASEEPSLKGIGEEFT